MRLPPSTNGLKWGSARGPSGTPARERFEIREGKPTEVVELVSTGKRRLSVSEPHLLLILEVKLEIGSFQPNPHRMGHLRDGGGDDRLGSVRRMQSHRFQPHVLALLVVIATFHDKVTCHLNDT